MGARSTGLYTTGLFVLCLAAACGDCKQDEVDEGYEIPPIENLFADASKNLVGQEGVLRAHRIRNSRGDNASVTLRKDQPLILDIGMLRYGEGPDNNYQLTTLVNFAQTEHQMVDYQGVEYVPDATHPRVVVSDFSSPVGNDVVMKTVVVPYEYFSGGSRHDFRLNLLLDSSRLPVGSLDEYDYVPPALPVFMPLSIWIVVNTPDVEGEGDSRDLFDEIVLERVDNPIRNVFGWQLMQRGGAFLALNEIVSGPLGLADIIIQNEPSISLDYFLWPACDSIPEQREMAIGLFNQGVLQGRMRKGVLVSLNDFSHQQISHVRINVPLHEGLNTLQVVAFPSPFEPRTLQERGCAHLSNVLKVNRVDAPAD